MNNLTSTFCKIINYRRVYYFSKNKIKKDTAQPIENIEKHMNEKLSILQNKINEFHKNFNSFTEIAKNSPLTYTALFARSCLIAKKTISPDMSYPIIQKLILRDNQKLTPFSCAALIQTMNYFKFDGNQQKILNKLCNFYKSNYNLFTFNQEAVFWKNYITIMNNKVHSTLEFINLDRKNNQIFQLCTLKQLLQKWKTNISINNKIIKQLTLQQNEINLKVIKPGKQNIQILIRIKQIDNINLIQNGLQKDVQFNRIKSKVLTQIRDVNNMTKKGWNVILHGKTLQNLENKQKYKWVNIIGNQLKQNKQQQQQKGYWKSQKMSQIDITTQQFLNSYQNRQNLYNHSKYSQGIFYDSSKIANRNVDMIITLLLGVNSKYSNNIKYFTQNKRQIQQNNITNYISLPQLKQCYGYTKSYKFHQQLFNTYIKVQSIIRYLQRKQKKQTYDLDFYQQLIQQQQLTDQDVKSILTQNTQVMSDITLNASKIIENINFNNQYNKQYSKVNQLMGNCSGEFFWQMRPFFDDTMRIMENVQDKIEKFDSAKDKNIKIAILSPRENIPYILQNIVQGKYWTIPKFKKSQSQQNKNKQKLLSQLLHKINKQ